MPEELSVGVAEPTLEEQVSKLFETPEAPPVDGKDAQSSDPSAAPVEPAPSQDQPEQNPTLEEQLENLEKEQPPVEEEEQPKLTAEQEQILKIIPSVEVGRELFEQAKGYQVVAGAFQKGDFEGVEEMFKTFSPAQFEQFEEYLYQKHLGGKEPKWVERWVKEQENPANKHMSSLEKKILSLEQKLSAEEEGKKKQAEMAEQQRITKGYLAQIDAYFDKINFSKSDRRYVAADLHNRVMENPQIAAKVRAGQFSVIFPLFKAAVTEYTSRDKEAVAAGAEKLKGQEQKKAPLGGGQPVVNDLPDDINQVPKEKRDGWMNAQIEKLFRAKK